MHSSRMPWKLDSQAPCAPTCRCWTGVSPGSPTFVLFFVPLCPRFSLSRSRFASSSPNLLIGTRFQQVSNKDFKGGLMPDTTAKGSLMDHLSLHNRYSCERAIRNGGVAAFISAAVTGLSAAAGFLITLSDPTLSNLMDPMLTVNLLLIVVLGVFVFLKSRIASTLLVVYFAVSKAVLWYQMGQVQ